jgi:hypothetical protein
MYDDYESDGFNDEWNDEYDYSSEPQEYLERSYTKTFNEGFLVISSEDEQNKYKQMSLEEVIKSDLCIENKFILYFKKKYENDYYYNPCKIEKIVGENISYSITLNYGAYDLPTMNDREIEFGKEDYLITTKFWKSGALDLNDIKNVRKYDPSIFVDIYEKVKDRFQLDSKKRLTCNLKTNTMKLYFNDVIYISNCDNIKTSICLTSRGYIDTEVKILNTNDINFIYNLEDSLKLVKKVSLETTNLKKAMDKFKDLEPQQCKKNFNGEYEIGCIKKLNYNNKYISSVNIGYSDDYERSELYFYTVTEDNLFKLSL